MNEDTNSSAYEQAEYDRIDRKLDMSLEAGDILTNAERAGHHPRRRADAGRLPGQASEDQGADEGTKPIRRR